MNLRSTLAGVFVSFFMCLAVGQKQPDGTAQPAASNSELAALVQKQFGKTFTLPARFSTPLITADFDGDGVEDAVIVANCAEPIPNSVEFKYQVVDPYNAYFGMNNPGAPTAPSTSDLKRNHLLLVVIFGAGRETWHAAIPKAKFVIVNLPFDTISVSRMLIKKNQPPIFVIKAGEDQLMDSVVWWDVKKEHWKWEPGNAR